jgi:hypothetical protein
MKFPASGAAKSIFPVVGSEEGSQGICFTRNNLGLRRQTPRRYISRRHKDIIHSNALKSGCVPRT